MRSGHTLALVVPLNHTSTHHGAHMLSIVIPSSVRSLALGFTSNTLGRTGRPRGLLIWFDSCSDSQSGSGANGIGGGPGRIAWSGAGQG